MIENGAGEVPVRIYFADTDAGGVCYYGRYLEYMERGRAELLRDLGVDQVSFAAESGRGFIVRKLNASYLAPARLDNVLTIRTRVQSVRKIGVHLIQEAILDGKVAFSAEVEMVCVDAATLRPAQLPPDLLAKIQQLKPADP
ncbi:MAG: YbgC/FadM family acyl-CoA thioesterase [Aquisalimonadaceae bacterium]